jgi:transcriptional regulator with XRE-family HTH domain
MLSYRKQKNRKEIKAMGYKIKEIREEIGMTQAELSIKSGVSRTIINGLETGRTTTTTTDTLKKIAAALDKKVSEIFFN